MLNGSGERVMTMTSPLMLRRRATAVAPQRDETASLA
jgi:hypothetical protein